MKNENIIELCSKNLRFTTHAKEEMKCVLCGGDLKKKKVEEEIKLGKDHVMVEVEAEVYVNCNERYYDEGVIEYLREVRNDLKGKKLKKKKIGLVYKPVI